MNALSSFSKVRCSASSAHRLLRLVGADVRGPFALPRHTYRVAGLLDNDRGPRDNRGPREDRDPGSVDYAVPRPRLDRWQRRDAALLEFVKSHESLTVDEWRLEKSGFRADAVNFESQLMHWCAVVGNLTLGRSLLDFMKAESEAPNLVTLSKFLRLLGDLRLDNWERVEEQELLGLYDKVVAGRETFLDANTAEDAIHGVCSTGRWREAVPLVDAVLLTCRMVGTSALVRVVMAAFRNGDFDLGWEFMARAAASRNRSALDPGFVEWMKTSKRVTAAERLPMVDRMLGFLRQHEIFLSEDVAADVKVCFERKLTESWKGQWTMVSARGICQACSSRLEGIELRDEEFSRLRDSFIDRVIEGKDVFLKTNPKELAKFKEFVGTTAPYSMVLDGLNVAYGMQGKKSNYVALAKQLLTVVQYVSESRENCKILILGRQHMTRWPKDYLNAIKQKAYLFFVDDLSKDDPYLLYAAMFSGQGTMLLSKDMMRDHLYSLRDPTLAAYFRRWLRGHQMELKFIKSNGEVVFKLALPHNPVAQRSTLHWHIPYDDGKPRMSQEVPNAWICLRKGSPSS